jgi:hypothetical protein
VNVKVRCMYVCIGMCMVDAKGTRKRRMNQNAFKHYFDLFF